MPIANSFRAETCDNDADHDVVNFNSSSVNMGHRYDRDNNEPCCEDEADFDVEEDQNDNHDSLRTKQPTVD